MKDKIDSSIIVGKLYDFLKVNQTQGNLSEDLIKDIEALELMHTLPSSEKADEIMLQWPKLMAKFFDACRNNYGILFVLTLY
ncbi:MAG: hypothetical protein H0U57_12310 [Tatlockia sp.]|nr:hypothetical protein [Tatlockia sp.]